MFSTDNPFATLGQRLDIIDAKQNEILRTLGKLATSQPITDEEPVNAEEAASELRIAKQTLYQNIRKIPHIKRFGRLYFYPSQLRSYLEKGMEVAYD